MYDNYAGCVHLETMITLVAENADLRVDNCIIGV